jgi:hypothetical protein
MKLTRHLKNRRLLAVLVGLIVFGGAYGLADSLNLTSDNLGAGTQVVESCAPSGDIEVSYDTAYYPSNGAYDVYDVVLDGIPESCAGEYFSVTLAGSDNSVIDTESGTLPADQLTLSGTATIYDPWTGLSTSEGGTGSACSAPLQPEGPSDQNAAADSCDYLVPISQNPELVPASDVTNIALVISSTQSDNAITTAPAELHSETFAAILSRGVLTVGMDQAAPGATKADACPWVIQNFNRLDSVVVSDPMEAARDIAVHPAAQILSGVYAVTAANYVSSEGTCTANVAGAPGSTWTEPYQGDFTFWFMAPSAAAKKPVQVAQSK